MAGKEGSVAPKERINIVYRPDTGGKQEDVELPFRFLVMGDFTGRESDAPIEERPVVGIDKDNFDDVLAAQKVAVDLTVPNTLSDENATSDLPVSLAFASMKDFGPDSIAQQIPALKKVLELRDALSALRGPLGNIPGFRRRLQAILDDPQAQQQLMAELGLGSDEPSKG